MQQRNIVYIGRSLDGYIAGKNGELDWLDSVPNPEGSDMGFYDFMAQIDAMLMGRNTFETVCNFKGEWPYNIPVFVLSDSLQEIPSTFQSKATLVKGTLKEILRTIHKAGYHSLYIDGGLTIQSFLKEDLIDEMIISTLPILLGGGIPLFGELTTSLMFEHVESKVFLEQIVQDTYRRKRK